MGVGSYWDVFARFCETFRLSGALVTGTRYGCIWTVASLESEWYNIHIYLLFLPRHEKTHMTGVKLGICLRSHLWRPRNFWHFIVYLLSNFFLRIKPLPLWIFVISLFSSAIRVRWGKMTFRHNICLRFSTISQGYKLVHIYLVRPNRISLLKLLSIMSVQLPTFIIGSDNPKCGYFLAADRPKLALPGNPCYRNSQQFLKSTSTAIQVSWGCFRISHLQFYGRS